MKKTILWIKSDDCIKDKLERLFELTDGNNNIEIIVPLLYEDYLKIDKLDAHGFIKFSRKKIYIKLFTTKKDIMEYIKTFFDLYVFDLYDFVSNKDINSNSYIEIKTLDNYINNTDQDTKEFIENFQKTYGENKSQDVDDKQNPIDSKDISGPKGEQGPPCKDSLENVLKKLKPFVKNYIVMVNKVFIPILKEDYKLLVKYLKLQLKDNVEWVICSNMDEVRTAVSELNHIFGSESKDKIINIYNNI